MKLNTFVRRRRRAVALLLAAASLVAVTGLMVGPAAASVVREPLTGLVRVSDTTTSDDDWVKFEDIVCPDNKTVVGTGWSTNPSTAQLRLQFLIPSRHSVIAQVYEDFTGYSSPWSLTVYATCADQPDGWSLSSYRADTNSDDYHSAAIDCPGATVPLAVGVEHMVPHGQVVVTDIDFNLTGVRVSAYEHEDGYDDEWWIRAHAVCANPPTGWELQSSSNQTSYPTTSELTGCTGDNYALSAGFDLNGAHGEVVVKSMRALTYQGDYGMATASEDETGTPDDWTFEVDVICVD